MGTIIILKINFMFTSVHADAKSLCYYFCIMPHLKTPAVLCINHIYGTTKPFNVWLYHDICAFIAALSSLGDIKLFEIEKYYTVSGNCCDNQHHH